jgi:glutamyl/glutaminyl-tRNA synthetase
MAEETPSNLDSLEDDLYPADHDEGAGGEGAKEPSGEDSKAEDEQLAEVLSKPVEELTDEEKALINTHQDKLTDEQKTAFASIFPKAEEYTKERFDGLMSTFNRKWDDQERDISTLTEQLKVANEKIATYEPEDPETKEASDIVKRVLSQDPVYKKAQEIQQREEAMTKILAESNAMFTQMGEEDKTQDFSKQETQDKYYNLAAELTARFKTPFTVYSAWMFEKEVAKKKSEHEVDLKKDEDRKKAAGLKPGGKGSPGAKKVDLDQSPNEFFTPENLGV